MSSKALEIAQRGLSAILCYGMIFSIPGSGMMGRYAHAETKGAPDITDDVVTIYKPASRGLEKPVQHKGVVQPEKPEKKLQSLPPTADCGKENFYWNAVNGKPFINAGPLCGGSKHSGGVTEDCWKQVFILLGAAEANASYVAMGPPGTPAPEKSPASAAAATTFAKMHDFDFMKNLNDEIRKPGVEDGLTRALDTMSSPSVIENSDHQLCCMKLVGQARQVGAFIATQEVPANQPKLRLTPKKQEKLEGLFNAQEQMCNGEAPPPAVVAQKKKFPWLALLLALGVGAAVWAIVANNNDDDDGGGSNGGGGGDRPTEEPPPCTDPDCVTGGGAAATTGTPGGGTTTPANGEDPGRDTGSSTGANTTPGTTGENPGRDTGSSQGTATGTTTGGNNDGGTDGSGNVTGRDYPDPTGNDGPGRKTGGDLRPTTLAPKEGRTLIK